MAEQSGKNGQETIKWLSILAGLIIIVGFFVRIESTTTIIKDQMEQRLRTVETRLMDIEKKNGEQDSKIQHNTQELDDHIDNGFVHKKKQ